MFLGGGRKLKYQEETHMEMTGTHKAQDRTTDHGNVRQQHYLLHYHAALVKINGM